MRPIEIHLAYEALSEMEKLNLIALLNLKDVEGLRQMRLEAFEVDNEAAFRFLTLAWHYKKYLIFQEEERRKGRDNGQRSD